MAFTDNCDIFVSVNEAGINQIVYHIMRQRPSLFNYGTEGVINNHQLLCAPIDAAPAVFQRSNPLLTQRPLLPVFGTHPTLGLDYVVQLTKAHVDFSPGNVIALPAELNPPLPAQRLALHFQVCGGLGCPDEEFTRLYVRYLPRPERPPDVIRDPNRWPREPTESVRLPSSKLNCFCLDLYAVGHGGITGPSGNEHAYVDVDGLDIVEITPNALEDSFLCYLKLALQLGILSGGYSIPALTETLAGITVSAEPTPTSAAVPFNPAVENDQVKLFINVTPTIPPPTVVPCLPSGGGGGGGGGGPTRNIGWGAGPAAPPGPEHLIIAVSAKLVSALFATVRNAFHPCFTPHGTFGPFTARLAAGGHLEDGNIVLANDDTISVNNLSLKWDTMKLDIDVNIPEICVGGFCIIGIPFDGCAVRAPTVCAFSANPDFTITIDLSGLATSGLSVRIKPLTEYGVETTRPAGMSDLDAEDAGIPNEWAVFLDPLFLHIDFLDIPAFVDNLLTQAVNAAVDSVLGFLPGWAKDLIKAILGGAAHIIHVLLGIPGDIVNWLSNLIGVDLDLFDLVTTALAQHFAKDKPMVQVEDPFPVMKAQAGPPALIPAKIPIRDLAVQINAAEMVLQAKVGA